MTRSRAQPSASPWHRQADADPVPAPLLTGLDVLAGGSLVVVAVVAWASLILAHLGRHSVPAVVALSLIGGLGIVLVCRLGGGRIRWRADRAGLVVGLGCAAIAGALTFPGFSYGVADKDPGGYVSHAAEIARTGSYTFTDEALAAHLPVQLISPGARFGGVWVQDANTGKIVPQFYHLWPALLATAYDLGGFDGIRDVVPVAGVLAVLCMTALLRRVGNTLGGRTSGLVAAAAGGLLLATNMIEVWQSRFPTTEVFAEALYLGSLLGVVVALQTRWRPAAGLAGLLIGIGWLNRADGLLLVLMAAGIGAALFAVRRFDARAGWFAVGLAVVVPHALLQAYHLALPYTQVNNVPSLAKVATILVVLVVLGTGIRVAGPVSRGLVRLVQARSGQLGLGLVVCVVAGVLLALGFLRGKLFGADYFDYNGVPQRSYDEAILRRLSWFFTVPGFGLMGVGILVVTLRRWRAPVWAVLLPTLALFPVYGFSARNSTRLLWWARRYVPTILPGVLILIALALAFGWVWRFRGRAPLRLPAAGALAALLWVFLGQSLPLRHHDEWAGSTAVTARIVKLAGDKRGVFFWRADEPCCLGPMALFATPVWLQGNELSVLLPALPDTRQAVLRQYKSYFRGRPIFIVGAKGRLPPGVTPSSVRLVDRIQVRFPMWDESDFERPSGSHLQPVDIAIWRVVGT